MMRELLERFRYRFELHAQEQRAERYGADGTHQPPVDRRWRLLFFLILLLNAAPFALWLIAVVSDAMFLIIPILYWIQIPAAIFGRPLFKPGYVSYEPVGTVGWCVVIAFWTVVATILWALIRVGLSDKHHHLTNR
jgi:hypothetical protein